MANIRKCIICGEIYEYCIHCGDAKKEEPWRYIYHDEKCRAIAHVLSAYKGNEISRKDFVDILNKYPDHTASILNNDSILAKEIKEIYGVKPQKNNHVVEATESIAEKTVEEPKTVEEEKHEETKAVRITRNKK